MRHMSSPKSGKSLTKVAAAMLLASAATGCSSDATRFSGLFSKTDNITTASIPQRQGAGAYGRAPMPSADIGSNQASLPAVPSYDYGSRNAATSQAYPAASGGYASPARVASAPVAVQRTELAPPNAGRDPSTRQEAMAQPFPARQAASAPAPTGSPAPRGDNLTTGTVKPLGSPQSAAKAQPMSGWSTVNAPRVTLKAGETVSTMAKRYGVPEKEILKANGGKVSPGQSIIIPTFGTAQNPAKNAAGDIDLANRVPAPSREPEQKVAVLPSRDKTVGEGAKITPASGGKPLGGTYTVKPGDSLAKIARETGTSVDQLKAANGLTSGVVRVGQKLKVANGVADPVTTASVPQPAVEKPAAAKPAAPAAVASAPAAQMTPVSVKSTPETASVSEVEKKSDVASVAPQSTGIGKYRWPVNGAVIASYGQNVEGTRNDGINISVPEGTPIKAAENGVVIYAGNGLKQLGNTVLVRHDDGKVTVYGHAGSINVTRGQKVTRGQTLASSGMSGDAKRPQVHFEVRKDATPVNPITYLE